MARSTVTPPSPAASRPEHRLLGHSKPMQTLRHQLERLARVPLPVLIHGETGTGKELAAQTLHEFADHRDAPFIALNCGAIPEGLVESELFGHRRGAFTGAQRDHVGAFVRAGTGTVFLDEIAELPLAAQTKLLRVLESRRLTPVGAEKDQPIHCRIVTATHRDLAAMVETQQFREDLYHRLGVVTVELPPLRRRPRDIADLLAHFVEQAGAELGHTVELGPDAVAAAVDHPWPGNVRALRNAVLRAATLADGPISAAQLLPTSEQPRARATTISVPRGSYASMHAALLQTVVAEEGSIRRAARVLEIPRSTLGSWLQRSPSRTEDDHDASRDGRGDPLLAPRRRTPTHCGGPASDRPLDPR